MCCPVCGMMHIKDPLLLIRKNSLCGGSGFPLSLSEWSFSICLMPYNPKLNVLSVPLNKTFLSFIPFAVEDPVMERWVVGSIPNDGPTELFLGPASAPQLV